MEKKIAVTILVLLFLVVCDSSKAQVIADQMSNKPLYQNGSADIKGSPFLLDNWTDADIKNSRGIVYKDLKVKFDLLNNVLIYELNTNLYQLNEQLDSFTLFKENSVPLKFVNSALINPKLPEPYLESLVGSGKLRLYKTYKKYIAENAAYNTANGIKEFELKTSYFLVRSDNTFLNVTLTQNQLKKTLADKWNEIEDYMKKNNISAKSEKDWKLIIDYFNKL